eukprot:SAG11_NODE_29848_length_306_cov_1.212560_1_plen_50_part_01
MLWRRRRPGLTSQDYITLSGEYGGTTHHRLRRLSLPGERSAGSQRQRAMA